MSKAGAERSYETELCTYIVVKYGTWLHKVDALNFQEKKYFLWPWKKTDQRWFTRGWFALLHTAPVVGLTWSQRW
jgi:hypothetical protein